MNFNIELAQQLRLAVATEILAALVSGEAIVWAKDSSCCDSKQQLVDDATEFADLLIEKIIETRSQK